MVSVMITIEELKEILKSEGVEEETINEFIETLPKELLKEILKIEKEKINPELLTVFARAYVISEKIDEYVRKRIGITMSEPLFKLLKDIPIIFELIDDNGNPYPMSYLIEDMILWLLRNPDKFVEFLNDNFEEVEESAEEETEEGV